MSSDDRQPLQPQIGALLRMAWEEVIDEIVAGLAAGGFDDLRPAHRPLIRDLLHGERPTELAVRLGLSKQAVNDILREFERNGYITLEPDPDDRRAKRVRATERGWELVTTASRLSSEVGRRWARLIGEERYAEFEAVLREIVAAQPSRPPATSD